MRSSLLLFCRSSPSPLSSRCCNIVMMMIGFCLLLLLLLLSSSSSSSSSSEGQRQIVPTDHDHPVYYTKFDDASWAVTSTNVQNVLGSHVKPLYDSYIDDCQVAVLEEKPKSTRKCSADDDFRIRMNRYQPGSVYNYTKAGYKKIKAPKELFDKLHEFYINNKGNDIIEWNHINTYHNMWESPPSIIHMNQATFKGGGTQFQQQIWNLVQPILEQWTNQKLKPVSLYGIRLYHNESILAPHVDRFPLVTSCIINIDQDLDEEWPLEVYGHDGIATNVSMVPGDMVLYESHSVIHGRPFPLKGRFYANVFVHFEPVTSLDPNEPSRYDPKLDLPPYLIPGSEWEAQWRHSNPKGWKGANLNNPVMAARLGDDDSIQLLRKTNPDLLHKEDENGWRPIHEAARAGNVKTVQLLLLYGEDLKVKTKYRQTPLSIAKQYLPPDHEMIHLLESLESSNRVQQQKKQKQSEL